MHKEAKKDASGKKKRVRRKWAILGKAQLAREFFVQAKQFIKSKP